MGNVRATGRYGSIRLAFRMLRLLRQEWRTLDELAEALHVSNRTARRVLEALEESGIAIERQRRPPHSIEHYCLPVVL